MWPSTHHPTTRRPSSRNYRLRARATDRSAYYALRRATRSRDRRWRQLTPNLFFSASTGPASVDDVSGPSSTTTSTAGFGCGRVELGHEPFLVSTRARRAAAQASLVDRSERRGAAVVLCRRCLRGGALDARHRARTTGAPPRRRGCARWFQFDQGLADYDDIGTRFRRTTRRPPPTWRSLTIASRWRPGAEDGAPRSHLGPRGCGISALRRLSVCVSRSRS